MRIGFHNNLRSSSFTKPSEPPAIAGMIYTGKRHVISGPPESLKTLITLAVCLDHVRAGGRVCYFDFENGPTAVRRFLDDLGATEDELVGILHFEPEGPPDQEDLDTLDREKISMVVVDSSAGAFMVSGLDDNSRQDTERFGNLWIKPFWTEGITTIVLDHVSKANEYHPSKFTIGSERKIGMADVHLGLQATTQLSRGRKGHVVIRTHKDRPGHLLRPAACEISLSSEPFTNRITWEFKAPSYDGKAWKPTVVMDRVMEHFATFPEPMDVDEIVRAVWGNPEYIVIAIDALVAEGRLAKDDSGMVTPQSHLIERDVPWDE